MIRTRLIATAASAPDQVITNDDLSKIVDTSDEWITQRTGIRERHISSGENTSVLVTDVASQLLHRASVSPESIDLIIVASVTPDYGTPSLACMVQKEIGAANAVAFDIVAACSGFMFALSIADKYIKSGVYKNAIVIGGETLSKIIDWKDRSTCVLFGDGAGGAYVERSEEAGIICEDIGSCGEQYDILTEGYVPCSNVFNEVPSGIHPEWYVHMDGREVFKFATKNVIKSMQKVMTEEGLTEADIKYIVPHQANVRIVEVISRKLNIPYGKFYMNMEQYGNTSSASIPIALNELNEKGLIARGDKIIMSGFGGGMTWGTMLIVW
ncbi:MAG: ketoacyl-ACP synthase III [Lachnospiraceae bacterium]|nr:ketoacyl-ACP synthase III [Lachnospiraceae bacterium]